MAHAPLTLFSPHNPHLTCCAHLANLTPPCPLLITPSHAVKISLLLSSPRCKAALLFYTTSSSYVFKCNGKLPGDEAGQSRKVQILLGPPTHNLSWKAYVLKEKQFATGLVSFCSVPQPLRHKHPGAVTTPSSPNKVRDREQKGNAECRTCPSVLVLLSSSSPVIPSASAATGGQMEKPTHPSQCRDKGGKSSAQRRQKAPAVCTGTCLPPAASSSLQPHNTASSQRPNGSWEIPAMEKNTAQSNPTGTENKRILTQKTGSLYYSCSSKRELAKLITSFTAEWTEASNRCYAQQTEAFNNTTP